MVSTLALAIPEYILSSVSRCIYLFMYLIGRISKSLIMVSAISIQENETNLSRHYTLTLTVLVTTIGAQWEGMGHAGSARYEPALLPPCPTIRVLIISYSN